MSKDTEYFHERAVTERAMAKTAATSKAADIHDELAEAYEALAEDGEPRPELSIVTEKRASGSG